MITTELSLMWMIESLISWSIIANNSGANDANCTTKTTQDMINYGEDAAFTKKLSYDIGC